MFYDKFEALCKERGLKPGPAAERCGINRSNVSLWKTKGYTPRSDALQSIADYFEVSVDYLLGKEEEKTSQPEGQDISDNDIKFALFGDTDIDDDSFEDVKRYAQFIAERKRKKEKK